MTPTAPFHSTPTTGGRRRGRLIGGAVLAMLAVVLVAVVVARPWDGPDGSPEAVILGTDGTQVIATPVRTDAAKLSDEEIDSAVLLLRERVKAAHAAGVEVSQQGDTDILVAFPDTADQPEIDRLLGPVDGAFRPVLAVSGPEPAEPSADAGSGTTTDSPDSPSDIDYYFTAELRKQFAALNCTRPATAPGAGADPADTADDAVVACAADGSAKYALGPVELPGTAIAEASFGRWTTVDGAVLDNWIVTVELTSAGTTAFRDTTTRLAALDSPLDQIALVRDRLVISAPAVHEAIPNGVVQISGSFTEDDAAALAAHLNAAASGLVLEIQSITQP